MYFYHLFSHHETSDFLVYVKQSIPDLTYVFLLVVGTLTLGALLWKRSRRSTALKYAMPFTKFQLVGKENVSHNTRLFKIALQSPDTVLGLPVGKHLAIRFTDRKGKVFTRPYTPTSSDDEIGYMELVIKIYKDGKMGQYLDHLSIGEFIEIQGPRGRIHYDRPSHISRELPGKVVQFNFDIINMIAGGTGLTPMYQVIQQIIKDKNDHTKVNMIYGNVTADDILCLQDLEGMRSTPNIDITLTLDKPPVGWEEESGYVTQAMIKRHLAPPTSSHINLICGPPPMVKGVKAALKEMGYARGNILAF